MPLVFYVVYSVQCQKPWVAPLMAALLWAAAKREDALP